MTGEATTHVESRPAAHLMLAQRALNACLALDPDARARLRAMDGLALTIEVRGIRRQYSVLVRDGSCRLRHGGLAQSQATVRGAPLALLRMAVTDGVRVLFTGQVDIQGDVEVAKRFKRLFDTLDIDWEEQLAGLIGDYPARRAMRMLRALGVWRSRSTLVLLEDIGDYLSEERQLLGNANQIADLNDAVDELRDDVARLSARLARCEHDLHDA